MSKVTEADQKQWDMFFNLKKIMGKHQFTFLHVNETADGVEISITMSKKGKTLDQIKEGFHQDGY